MRSIDPHIHMISRVTDDYHRMALSSCVTVSEPRQAALAVVECPCEPEGGPTDGRGTMHGLRVRP
jgi:hypothetical protein